MRRVRLGDLFTSKEFGLAIRYKDDVKSIEEKVVKSALPRINKVTKQENDPTYWAYVLQHYVQGLKI